MSQRLKPRVRWFVAVLMVAAVIGGGTALAAGSTLKVNGPGTTVTSGSPYTVTVSGNASGKANALIGYVTTGSPCKSTLNAERSQPAGEVGPDTVHGKFTKKFPFSAARTGKRVFCAYLYHHQPAGPHGTSTPTLARSGRSSCSALVVPSAPPVSS